MSGLKEGFFAILVARLRARLAEVEDAVFRELAKVAPEQLEGDPAYVEGSKALVAACLDYCLQSLEGKDPQIPDPVLRQARRAARSGVSGEILAMRLAAGKQVVVDFAASLALREGGAAVQLAAFERTLEEIAARLISGVLEEYAEERVRLGIPRQERRLEAVRALLAGKALDEQEQSLFRYRFEGRRHLALVAYGKRAATPVRAVAARFGLELLEVEVEEGVWWLWFGSSRLLPCQTLRRELERAPEGRFAVGRAEQDTSGWRASHEQARAAARVIEREPASGRKVVYWPEVAVTATLLAHPALARGLVEELLAPLETLRISGREARETLRAYFACGGNGASAAKVLGVDRRTVAYRLREIEGRIGTTLRRGSPELQAALALEQLGVPTGS